MIIIIIASVVLIVVVVVISELNPRVNEETNRPTTLHCVSIVFISYKEPMWYHYLYVIHYALIYLFSYGLFNRPVSVSGYIPLDGRIINKF